VTARSVTPRQAPRRFCLIAGMTDSFLRPTPTDPGRLR
jgi:hypothetical protein